MRNIYVSYSGRNCEAVLQVMEAVISMGCGLVCDCLLPSKEAFEQRVHRAIAQSDLMVTVITDDAETCPYMAAELDAAAGIGTTVLPITVSHAPLPYPLGAVPNRLPMHKLSDFPTAEELSAVKAVMRDYLEHL